MEIALPLMAGVRRVPSGSQVPWQEALGLIPSFVVLWD